MENASKALIMAGSILMALLVIGILVFGYGQLSSLEQTKEDVDQVDKMSEYMRRFEQFNRGQDNPLYGSELLSLANLQEDYNSSDAEVGYDKIQITVEIKNTIDKNYFKAGKYDISKILEDKNRLLKEKDKYENKNNPNYIKYNGKSVKYYSKKSYREIANDFEIDIPSTWGNDLISEELYRNDKTKKLMQDIQNYSDLNTIYNEFRTGKRFYCPADGVEYDNYNGRIKKMTFVEV